MSGDYTYGEYDGDYCESYIGTFEITGDRDDLNIDLKKVTGKINFSPAPPSLNQDLSLKIPEINDSVSVLAYYKGNTLNYEFYLQHEGEYTLDASQDLMSCVADDETIDFTFSGESLTLPDIDAIVGSNILFGFNWYRFDYFPYTPIEKVVLLEAPEGAALHEKSVTIDLGQQNSAKKSAVSIPQQLIYIINYYVITGLQPNDKLKIQAYSSSPILKTTIREFTCTDPGNNNEPEPFLLDFDINKTNQPDSNFVPEENATGPYVLDVSGNSVLIPPDSLWNLAGNNQKHGVKYNLDNAGILLSGSLLSHLSDTFKELGLYLQFKDDSFADAKPILELFREKADSNEDLVKLSDKLLLFQLGSHQSLSEKIRLNAGKDELDLGDVDYSKVKAYFYNPSDSSFTELQTTWNAENQAISFETDKTGYFVFAVKLSADVPKPADKPKDNKPEENKSDNPDTGDGTAANILWMLFFGFAGIAALFLKKKTSEKSAETH